VINTGTTVLTFLMVFVLQHSQNRDAVAIQAKLDELIMHTRNARNDLIEAEKLTEEEVELLRQHRAAGGVLAAAANDADGKAIDVAS
jgi:low affinity Fe/Cu permease